jgi:hypothetical protein
MQIKGVLEVIHDTVQVTDTFKRRGFVVAHRPREEYDHIEYISFELIQDKCGLLDHFNKGDTVSVYFNLKGRQYQKDDIIKYFNTLQAWRIDSSLV